MKLKERITGKIPGRVRVSDDGPYHGLEGKVKLVYYDRLHTGSSYDLLEVELDNGEFIQGPANLFETIEK